MNETTLLDEAAPVRLEPHESPERSSSARGWVVLLAALGINLVLGLLYAWGVIAKALTTHPQWRWTKTEAAMPFTVSTVAFAVMMVFAGRMQDKVGPRWIAMLGGFLFGAGLIASSSAGSPMVMALTFGILGGVGIGLGYSATTPPAIKWFHPSRKGVVTGVVVSGVGVAAVYASPLAQWLLATTDVARTFQYLGLGTIVVVCLLAQLLRNPPAGYVAAAGAASPGPLAPAAAASRRNIDWHEMLRTRQFYQLWAMFVLAASAGLMIIVHVAVIGKEQANLAWGFLPVALLAIFNTVGRVASGFLSDRVGRTRTMVLAFVLQAANMFAFSYYGTPALVLFGAAFTGFCYGTIFTLMPAATADYYGVKNLGVNYGLVFTAFGAAGVLGPIMGGRVRDLTGAYAASYLISAILLLMAAALALMTRAPAVAGEADPVLT